MRGSGTKKLHICEFFLKKTVSISLKMIRLYLHGRLVENANLHSDLTLRHPETNQVLSISDHEPIEVEIEFGKKNC